MSTVLDQTAPVLPAEAANGPFAAALERTEHDKARVLLTRAGRPIAALVPIEDVALLEAWEDERDGRIAEQAVAQWEAEGRPAGVTHDEMLARYGITPESA